MSNDAGIYTAADANKGIVKRKVAPIVLIFEH
jgi:hypothetical protein